MRIVIMGDSLSDPGNKQHTLSGIVARASHKARINKAGRFSDGKNWTDFIWEWAGGNSLIQGNAGKSQELTKKHLSLKDSKDGNNHTNFSYVNYAVGGAVIEESKNLVRKLGLTTIDEQKDKYFTELYEEYTRTNNAPDDTLHIIWAGLNDSVTDGKDPAEMKGLVDKIEKLIDETHERFKSYGGNPPRFMLINNPNPQAAVRYADNPNSDKVVKAKKATDEFNRLLRQRFPDNEDMVLVDMNAMMKEGNFYKLRLIKASQNHGQQVQYEKPYIMDASLANMLIEFRQQHGNTEEGKRIYNMIKGPLKEALGTNNEIRLHQEIGNIIIKEIMNGNTSSEVKAIRDALMVTGTYPNQVDFAIQYYQAIHNDQKHKEDINKIQRAIDAIYAQNIPRQLNNNLNVLDTELYTAVYNSLLNSKSKGSTYRKLIADVTANNFGFVSTSDRVHPTEALHKILALKIADTMINHFPMSNNNFIENVKNAYAETGIFTPDNPLDSLNEPLPSGTEVKEAQKIAINYYTIPGLALNPEVVKAKPSQQQIQPGKDTNTNVINKRL